MCDNGPLLISLSFRTLFWTQLLIRSLQTLFVLSACYLLPLPKGGARGRVAGWKDEKGQLLQVCFLLLSATLLQWKFTLGVAVAILFVAKISLMYPFRDNGASRQGPAPQEAFHKAVPSRRCSLPRGLHPDSSYKHLHFSNPNSFSLSSQP